MSPLAPTPPTAFRGVFRDDALARAVYSEAAGVARIMPRAVAVPADADDLVTGVDQPRSHDRGVDAAGHGRNDPHVRPPGW